MRLAKKNKQQLYYALYKGEMPIYTEYKQEDGSIIQLETGKTRLEYENPVEFESNIAMSGGESESVEFGLNRGDYEAVIVMPINSIPITETSLIWHENEPKINTDGTVDPKSADYTVIKPIPSLNVIRYALKKVVK